MKSTRQIDSKYSKQIMEFLFKVEKYQPKDESDFDETEFDYDDSDSVQYRPDVRKYLHTFDDDDSFKERPTHKTKIFEYSKPEVSTEIIGEHNKQPIILRTCNSGWFVEYNQHIIPLGFIEFVDLRDIIAKIDENEELWKSKASCDWKFELLHEHVNDGRSTQQPINRDDLDGMFGEYIKDIDKSQKIRHKRLDACVGKNRSKCVFYGLRNLYMRLSISSPITRWIVGKDLRYFTHTYGR